MLPVKTYILKNPQCSQLLCALTSLMVRWAASAFLKKKYATYLPEACKHSLHYDGRPDWCFGVVELVYGI